MVACGDSGSPGSGETNSNENAPDSIDLESFGKEVYVMNSISCSSGSPVTGLEAVLQSIIERGVEVRTRYEFDDGEPLVRVTTNPENGCETRKLYSISEEQDNAFITAGFARECSASCEETECITGYVEESDEWQYFKTDSELRISNRAWRNFAEPCTEAEAILEEVYLRQ